jgi:hypothetical protein
VIRAGPYSLPPAASTMALVSHLVAAQNAVAWRDEPASTPNPIQLARRLPSCRADHLTARTFASGGTAGAAVFRLQIVNQSNRVCALRGHPVSMAGITNNGAASTLHPLYMRNGVPYVFDQPAILPVGASADMAILAPVNCVNAISEVTVFRSLEVGLASGMISAPYAAGGIERDQPLSFPCNEAVTPFARWDATEGDGARFSGVMALRATLPEYFHLRPGQRQFRYVVTLANPTGSAIRVRSCPTYTESLAIQTTHGIRPGPNITKVASYRLNCSGIAGIRGHSSLRFAMEIPVPGESVHSPGGTLEWRLNVLDGTGPETSSFWCGACAAPS